MGLVFVGSVCFAAELKPNSCDESLLPVGVKQVLISEFASWRVLKVEDLPLEHQNIWREAKPEQCPGIAVGTFEPRTGLSYALSLIPRSANSDGYRIVVLTKNAQDVYLSQWIGGFDEPVHRQVIYRVPPGRYPPGAEGTERIRLIRDGFKVEEIGVGAALYYWEDTRYVEWYRSREHSELGGVVVR